MENPGLSLPMATSTRYFMVKFSKSLLESVTGHPKAWTQTRLLQLATGFGALLHFQARSESSGSLELVFHNTRVITDEIE